MRSDKVRVPKQKRSIEVKDKIKRAASTLFSEKGYYNTSTNEIAKCAGVSVGSVYSYFPDKKAVFLEVLHEYNRSVVAQVADVSIENDSDIPVIIANYIRAVFDAHDYSPEFHREILVMAYSDDEIREILSYYEDGMIARIEYLLSVNSAHTEVTDFKNAAYIIFKSVEEVVHGIKIFGRKCNEDAVLTEVTKMVCRYLMLR